MTTRSKQLAYAHVTTSGAYVTIYTCPSGHVAIVKDFRLYCGSTGGSLYVGVTKGSDHKTFVKLLTTGDTTGFVDELWVVLEEADELFVYQVGTGGGATANDYVVSGAELIAP